MSHFSINSWVDTSVWQEYFAAAERILDAKLTILDTHDPMRRRVSSLNDAAKYVCAFTSRENSRWIFGKLADMGIEIEIQHYKNIKGFPNTISWRISEKYFGIKLNYNHIKKLFDLGNYILKPFYSFADYSKNIDIINKSSGSIDIHSQLLGVFWLTYLNSSYVEFFGKERVSLLPNFKYEKEGGITIMLSGNPEDKSDEIKQIYVNILGNDSFVNLNSNAGKLPGRFALTFSQMRNLSEKKIL